MSEVYALYLQENRTVLEEDSGRCSFFDGTPIEWLDALCLRYGSSYEGRCASFCHVLGIRQKPCVLVSERKGNIYLPTRSAENPACVWLLYNAIVSTQRKDSHHTIVKFTNHRTIEINADIRVILGQMKRCEAYLQALADSGRNDQDRVKELVRGIDQ
ncbi:MAG: competence protein ComK [Solobacterium sp.]|jgi:competence protein ComK|nr:competence protein ComK [Solobacterium sp.]MCH4049990.1 competence protein ComK [Solobacterium sp.]MCH4073675.1 competence protein ComK [Solobacterium sp.]MCI1313164.1 competence protein ComK [Solobacterium sp.]MCI1346814.1 competence protein ComK [Solobacterium sp.]